MSGSPVVRARAVELDALEPEARARLEDRLVDIYLSSFEGPSREQVLTHFVRRGPDLHIELLLDAAGEVVGFTSSAVGVYELGGERYAVFDGGVYVLPGFRGGGNLGLRRCLAHGVRYRARHPLIRYVHVGLALTPVSYRRGALALRGLLPRPGREEPRELTRLVRAVSERKGWVAVGGDPWVINRPALGLRFRRPEHLRESAEAREDEFVRYFEARVPNYLEGDALVVYYKLGAGSIGDALLTWLAP